MKRKIITSQPCTSSPQSSSLYRAKQNKIIPFGVSTVSRLETHLCRIPASGRFPLLNVVEKLQLWSSSSPSGTSKALNVKSFRTCLHTVGRCWELPHNKHQTTSSKSSAQWPTAWSEEACSPCWAPSHDLGVRPTLLDMVLAKRHQSGKVLSRANVSQTLKTKGRFRFAEKQPVWDDRSVLGNSQVFIIDKLSSINVFENFK